jgi:hypothetical protein
MKKLATNWIIVIAFAMTAIIAASIFAGPFRLLSVYRSVSNSHIRRLPISLSFSTTGGLSRELSWYLSVNSAGQAVMKLGMTGDQGAHIFQITEKQFEELRYALIREKYFELDDEYGQLVSDSSEETMTISVGEYTKSVRIRFLMNYVNENRVDSLREPARALRIWKLVRNWFRHLQFQEKKEPINLSNNHEKVLKAVPQRK